MVHETPIDETAEFDLGMFDEVPPDQFGPTLPLYPAWQWTNGSQRQKAVGGIAFTGGWFLPEVHAPEGLEMNRWTFVTENGAEVPGFSADALQVAVIAYRRCWQVGSREGFQRFPWEAFDRAKEYARELGERARGRVHALVAIRGQEALGPFVLNVAGMASKAFLAEVIQAMGKTLKDPASRIVRASRGPRHPGVPLRTFWITIGYRKVPTGAPYFMAAGKEGLGTLITPPTAWDLPAKPVKRWEELQPFFVGKPNLDLFSTWYEEAQDWLKAWDAENSRPEEPRNGEVVEPGEEGREIEIPSCRLELSQ